MDVWPFRSEAQWLFNLRDGIAARLMILNRKQAERP
jgi:hypothetical protein